MFSINLYSEGDVLNGESLKEIDFHDNESFQSGILERIEKIETAIERLAYEKDILKNKLDIIITDEISNKLKNLD